MKQQNAVPAAPANTHAVHTQDPAAEAAASRGVHGCINKQDSAGQATFS